MGRQRDLVSPLGKASGQKVHDALNASVQSGRHGQLGIGRQGNVHFYRSGSRSGESVHREVSTP